jgi:hypothetical protein
MAIKIKPDIFHNPEYLSENFDSSISNNLYAPHSFDASNNSVEVEGNTNIKIGDFQIKAKDLGRLLEKFAKQFMPEVLI